MSSIDKAIAIASQAHMGQKDKAGKPYILHPLRLMNQFDQEVEMIVAVLHDVIEDSEVTSDDLKNYGFSDAIVNAVECLSRKVNENYEDFINRVSLNELAKKIKIADIKDNLDVTRLSELSEKDLKRLKKYHGALKFLNSVGPE